MARPHLLVQVVITPLVGLEFCDAAIAFVAELAVERFSGFAGGFGLGG